MFVFKKDIFRTAKEEKVEEKVEEKGMYLDDLMR